MVNQKLASCAIALEAGVKTPKLFPERILSARQAQKAAQRLGFPLMIKPNYGRGGRAAVVVGDKKELTIAFERLRKESEYLFGNWELFAQEYIENARVVEVQVVSDAHGQTRSLGERERSIERRFQNVICEAPVWGVSEPTLEKMRADAKKIAKKLGVTGLCTIEFLVTENEEYFFLEANARLPVQHGPTERMLGLDLIKMQIEIALGAKLEDVLAEQSPGGGHSIELRVYAEDFRKDFAPSFEAVSKYRNPAGPGVRIDDCIEEGMENPYEYDAMPAKLNAYAANRVEALKVFKRAVNEYIIEGPETTLEFARRLADYGPFVKGVYNANLTREFLNEYAAAPEFPKPHNRIAALVAAILSEESPPDFQRKTEKTAASPWQTNRR